MTRLSSDAEKQGWEEVNSFDQSAGGHSMKMLSYKKDQRTLTLMVAAQGEKTTINITTAKK